MIRPTHVNADGSFDFVFDELGHTGTIALSGVAFGRDTDGSPNFRTLAVTCPDGCGSVTYHPITGDGLIRQLIQAVFLAKVVAAGCPCGALTAGKAPAIVRAHLRAHVTQLAGDFLA